ncbi:MAG: UDP-glucose/GDP-mannose dehydrogenase family protein [Saprospiraceae bacterium]|nr:UDP-glucose/GDP-mannose dehydrogenase family protein [Saprospiraceae bacterium]MBK8851322.1 UDP-glucose/GDP-mannose dehydrogenase family protein [Saprospiraceae bacterium]MBL0085031.1 UDP-glucose/GDP-mannose dehydrogenase family protein [Saprospiraceae bacterium]
MNIAVVGTGYVGLVTGTCFAETGNHVVCIDIDAHKVQRMQNGEVPIYEPGLETLFERNTKAGRLSFTTDLKEGIKQAKIIFLALPTPPGEDGSADLKYILQVAADLSGMIEDYKVIVDKSTVPVGTAEKVQAILEEKLSADLFDVVSNPEFLREGVAVDDFLKPDRVVIGVNSKRAEETMLRLYEPFVRQGNPIIVMDIRSAELTKYAANAYLATRISFMNEIANLCERLGADVDHVRKGMGSDTRIGKRFLFPGVGYGGSCFPKDVMALSKAAGDVDYKFRILDAVMTVNEKQKEVLFDKINRYFKGDVKGKTIAVWGLAFKPETDDIREAPAITLIRQLQEQGAQVKAYDPEAMENFRNQVTSEVQYCEDMYEALDGADALAVITEWSVFRMPDFDLIKSKLSHAAVFDGRNVYSVQEMEKLGFHYESIGR